MPHVFVVASGFGLRVIPVAGPYRFRLGPESNLDVERPSAGKWLFARVIPDEGGYQSQLLGKSLVKGAREGDTSPIGALQDLPETPKVGGFITCSTEVVLA